jgi:uncharacterized peroxidase-related enzyme
MTREQCEAWLRSLAEDWRRTPLDAGDRALCTFAEKLSRTPAGMNERDIAALRDSGFDDEAIHDAVQVVSYFNYINRIADAIDVELEPEMAPDPRREV